MALLINLKLQAKNIYIYYIGKIQIILKIYTLY